MGFDDTGLAVAMADSYNRSTAERAERVALDNQRLLAALLAMYGLEWDGQALIRRYSGPLPLPVQVRD